MSHLLKTISLTAIIAVAGPLAAQEASDGAPADETGTAAQGSEGDAGATTTDDAGTAGPEAEAGSGEEAGDAAPVQGETPDLSMGESAGAEQSEGEEAEGPGSTYTEETFGDWQQRCVRTESGDDPCQLYQLLRDDQGNAVAEMSLFALPEGQQAAAGATLITPLETLLTRQITLAVDGGAAKRYPFDFCAQQGCFARVGFTDADVQAFKRGGAATVTIVPAAAPDQEIALEVSLSGFTAGYDAVQAVNAD